MYAVENWEKPKCFAVRHKDEVVRASSRSGGIFTALSDAVLAEAGVIYGCVLTDDLQAAHIRAEDLQTRNRMRESKYLPSNLGETFVQARTDLESGRKVLFSGTPCQIAGLKRFLGKNYENLLCVDIICHGVPSPRVWKEYLAWQEAKHGKRIVSAEFRNKRDFGWDKHVETLHFADGSAAHSRVFRNLFMKRYILRPICYECPYKRIKRPGDISIGDYWHIEKAAPEMHDNRGVSLVLINNVQGEAAFSQVMDSLLWKETRLEDSMQLSLYKNSTRPADREKFWDVFESKGFAAIVRRYGEYGWTAQFRRVLRVAKRKIKALLRRGGKKHG